MTAVHTPQTTPIRERPAAERASASRATVIEDVDGTSVSLARAAVLSGYSSRHLSRLIETGALTNTGTSARPRVLVAELPRKPGLARRGTGAQISTHGTCVVCRGAPMPRKRTKGKTRRWSTGHKGQNCVKLFSSRRGNLNLEWYEHSGGSWSRRCRSLGHSDFARAKEEAKDFAAGLRRGPLGIKVDGLVPLGMLLDTYESKVTAHKAPSSKGHEQRVFKLAIEFFGREFDVTKLDQFAWDNYIFARRTGALVPEGRKKKTRKGNRIIQQDLAALQTVFRWACKTRDTDGEFILDRNP